MATTNPYDEEMKRQSILQELDGPNLIGSKAPSPMGAPRDPMSTTMPVGGDKPPIEPMSSPMGTGKRDQWSLAGDISNRGDFGRLTGFNASSFDPGSGEQSFKNQMGRIMSRYDPRSPNAIQALAADPDFAASGYRIEGNDKIVGPDGFPVDILRNAMGNGSGDAWAWQTSNPADQMGGAPAAQGMGGMGVGSNLGSVMQEIQALANGGESPLKRQQILDMLMDPSLPQEAI